LEDKSDTNSLLERIAIALERIADSLAVNNLAALESNTEGSELFPSPEPAEPSPVINDTFKLQTFLSSRGITIKNIPPEKESDETLDKIAVFIGNKLDTVREVLDTIKANMNAGRPFNLNLRNESQQTVADTTNLCTNLFNIAFLTAYHYQKSPAYQLYATPSTSPQALNFYSGQWLERFIKTQVISLLNSKMLEFSYICNAQISLPNGDDFELDMLFETEGEIFWFEAKTGDYQKHIDKYSKISRMIGLDCSHTFLILADGAVTDSLARDLSSLHKMTVVCVGKFAEQLEKVLSKNRERIVRDTEAS
jgi:hypothetical protein